MACPNKNLDSWKDLVKIYDSETAEMLFTANGEEIPTIERAIELLHPEISISQRRFLMKGISRTPDAPIDRVTSKSPNVNTVSNPGNRSTGNEKNYQFQLSSSGEPVDKQLNEQLTKFVKVLKGEIRTPDKIVINGKEYNAVAVTDIINKIISVVEGRAGKDTLPEEVGHLFVEYLPEGSLLLSQMMSDIRNRSVYSDVYEEYKDNDLYQNEDGSVNEDKIAREAIGKMIAKAINNEWESQKEKSTWQKLWDKLWKWIEGVINIFKNKTENARDVQIHPDMKTMDLGSLEGTKETPEMQKYVNDMIINHPDEPIKGGESFNGFKDRVLNTFKELITTVPDHTLFVANSTVLKLIDSWMKAGSKDTNEIDMNHFMTEDTNPGEMYEFKTHDGKLLFGMRHGETTDNVKDSNGNATFRTQDAELTLKGVEEVKQDSKRFDNIKIPLIIVPDTVRNQQTAAIIKGEDPYSIVAKNILSGDTSKLNMKKFKEAEYKGMYYLQMSEGQKKFDKAVDEGVKTGIYTEKQYNNYVKIHRDPHERMILDTDDAKHDYWQTAHLNEEDTIRYTPNTMAIGGDKGELPGGQIARERGNGADKLFQAIATGDDWETINKEVDTSNVFSPEIKEDVYKMLKNIYDTYIEEYSDGTKDLGIVQSILTYEAPGAQRYLAASSDFIIIAPDGSIKKIIDLKTTTKPMHINGQDVVQFSNRVGKGSWLPEGTLLTKNQEHTLQLTNEQAMIEIAHPDIRIQPDALGIHSIIWKIDKNDKNKIIGVIDGKLQDKTFDQARWTQLSHGAMIPAGPKLNIFDEPTPEQLKEALEEGTLTQRDYDNIINEQAKREVILDDVLKNINELLSIEGNPKSLQEFTPTVAAKFKALQADILELQDNGEKVKALMTYIRKIRGFTKLYENYIKDKKNFNDPNYYLTLQETIKVAEANLQVIPNSLRKILSKEDQGVYNGLIDSVDKLKQDYTLYAIKYVEEHIASKWNLKDLKDKDGNVVKTVAQQIHDILWKPEDDITTSSLMGDAIREMTVPLLGQLSLTVEKARLEATIATNKMIDDHTKLGQDFEKATGLKLSDKASTDFLFKLKDGNRERFLDKIGDSYYQIKAQKDALVLDAKSGKKMEPIPNAKSNVETEWNSKNDKGEIVTEKVSQLEYNNRLYYLRKERREFYKPETTIEQESDETGYSVKQHFGGVYHSLHPEYIKNRDEVMSYVGNKWVERTGASRNKSTIGEFNEWEKNNKEKIDGYTIADKWNTFWHEKYLKFQEKYQTYTQYWEMKTAYNTDTKTYEPTGEFIRKNGFFPQSQYIKVNENKLTKSDYEMVSGESMRSKEYESLLNDRSNIGIAKLNFYNDYMSLLSDLVKKGGEQCEQWYNRGGLINLPNKFIKSAAEKGIMNQIGHTAAEWFTAVPDGSVRYTDIFGIPTQRLSIPLMSNVRNIQTIKKIENDITTLESDRKSGAVSLTDYYTKKEKLDNQLKAENHKNDSKDLEHDPIKLLSSFGVGVEKYHQLSQVEGEILALRDIIKQNIVNEKEGKIKQFKQTGNIGQELTRSKTDNKLVFKRADKTNALKKVEDYVKMFYGETYSKGNMDVIVDRIMNITSFSAMGFNYLGHFKNSILYQASNFRQNIAERFVTRKNYTTAQAEFFKDFLPGMQTKLFEKKSGPFRAHSKMEWMMHNFGLDADAQLKAQGKAGKSWMDMFYMGENFAIHWAQYTMQTAYMRDQMLKDSNGNVLNDKNGNPISMYDAYQWDPNLGKCVLREEAKDTMDQQKNIVITAKDIQTKTQGNFDELNKPLIKNYLMGRMLSQFHNYFKTAWNDRFDKAYTHTTLGEMEGTWTSVVSYCKVLKEFEGHWYSNLKNGWNGLSEHQQKNLKTDLAELLMVGSFLVMSYLIKSAAKGLSSSQDPNKKKFLNMLSYTFSAVGKEQGSMDPVFGIWNIGDMIKDPMAISPIIKGLAQALLDTVEYPFQDDKHRHYQKGVFKGNSKAMEDWKKMIPVLKQLHRWANFLDMGEYEPGFAR